MDFGKYFILFNSVNIIPLHAKISLNLIRYRNTISYFLFGTKPEKIKYMNSLKLN